MTLVLWLALTLSAYVGFAVFAVLMARAAANKAPGTPTEPPPLSRFDLAFLLITALFIITARLPVLQLSRDLQPDEAQFSANAIMAATNGWLNWDTSDSGSSGPLNVMIQAWPLLFGLDITFTTMHITGAVLACALAILIYLVLRIEFGRLYAVIFSFPVALFLGATTYWDLVHTTSLYFPLTLATFGLVAAVSVRHRPNTLLAIAGAVALGMIVLTKLQAAPLGLLIGLGLLIAYTRHESSWTARALKALPVAVSAILPLTLSLLPLALSGHLNDFIMETVVYSAAYVASPINPLRWVVAVFSIPLLALMVALFALAILASAWLWLREWRNTQASTWFSAALLVVVGFCIMSSGRVEHHYLLFLVPFLPLLAASLTREALSRRPTTGLVEPHRMGLLAAAVALIMLPGAIIEAMASPALRTDGALATAGMRFRSPQILQYLLPHQDDRLIVYGYMPYFYMLAGMQPATRQTWSETVILNHKRGDREYYRQRFISEMDRHRPAIIVDAVTFTDHVYRDPVAQGPQAFPDFAERLDRDYIRVSRNSLEAGCPQTYLRRDRFEQLNGREAEIASVTASGALRDDAGEYRPEHVIDHDVFESCIDRWLAPAQAPARLDLKLKHPEPISRVALLNTRGEWRFPNLNQWGYDTNIVDNVSAHHAANSAVVRLMNGDSVIVERRVTVDACPYWTNVQFGNTSAVADHVVIHFPDWHGQGPGLNEVAVYRAETLTVGTEDRTPQLAGGEESMQPLEAPPPSPRTLTDVQVASDKNFCPFWE